MLPHVLQMTVVTDINSIDKWGERPDDQHLTSLPTSLFLEITHELKEYLPIFQMQFYLVISPRAGQLVHYILFY